MKKLVYGVGISEDGVFKRSITVDGKSKKTPEYELWKNMLARCYSKAMHKRRPTYIGCTVSENFKNFQWFAAWCHTQVGFGLEGYQLEKDIIIKGNKIYSEHTCRFVPNSINMLLAKSDAARGDYPIGVQSHKNGFIARCGNTKSRSIKGKGYIGIYSTPEEAFAAYKKQKEKLIRDAAVEYEDFISADVFEALLNYEVEITD